MTDRVETVNKMLQSRLLMTHITIMTFQMEKAALENILKENLQRHYTMYKIQLWSQARVLHKQPKNCSRKRAQKVSLAVT